MKKIMFIIILFSAFMFLPCLNVNALSISNKINILDNTQNIDMSQYNQDQDCSPSGLLGDPNDENSVAWLLQKVFNYVKVIGPILVVILSSIDFLKVIFNGDDDAMKKAQKKLATRLVLAAALFFIPTIVQALLRMFGITANPTCGIN